MGGFGSGRQDGEPTADASLKIDIAWMLRAGFAREGLNKEGTLRYTCGGETCGSISYRAIMDQPGGERLELSYLQDTGDHRERVQQTVRLVHTRPHFGGKRWWMTCPCKGTRVGKLYLPPGGDRFASRHVWRLAYQSQRNPSRDRPFDALFRLQRRLGCTEGWEQPIRRPKGMWQQTFRRYEEQYWALDQQCAAEMITMVDRIRSGRA